MRTYLCLDDFSTIFSEFFRLSLLSVGFFTLTLFCQSLHFYLFFLCLYFSKFFFSIGNIDLPDIVEININLLCPCFSHSLCFINHNLVNEFVEHQIGNFCRLFALAYQRNEMLNINRICLFFGQFLFHFLNLRFQFSLFIIVLLHQLLILSFGQ